MIKVGVALAVALAVMVSMTIHQVPEGFVGVYWRGGALLSKTTDPGFHVMLPFLTSVDYVQVTLQTDEVTDIPCGTSGGVIIHFEKVEVVNRLRSEYVVETVRNYTVHYDRVWVFDKIHHEINQFCSTHTLEEVYITLFDSVDERLAQALQDTASQWAPGLDILFVRITKPKLPAKMLQNYESMELEKTKLVISQTKQRVSVVEAETEKLRATIEADKIAEISRVHMEQQLAIKESERTIAKINDEIYLAHERILADSNVYELEKQSSANSLLLSKKWMTAHYFKSLQNVSKTYYGPSLPAMFREMKPDVAGS